MLRSLVGEVVRRRLWPIPLAAILIAIAAPLLFMKSAADAPAGSAVPPVAAPGELPASAERLVTTSDKAVTPRQKAKPKGQDPFAPPASARKVVGDAAAAPTTTPAASVSAPSSGAVVIRNSDGSTATMPAPKTTTKATTTKKATTKKSTTPKVTTPKVTTPEPTTSSAAASVTTTYVDVRFGRRQNTMLRFRVPRLQAFRAGGKVAAMFVNYDKARHVAVFAIAPSTTVAGDVDCRKVKGVCRYVDIPAGSYARLRLHNADGSVISRRLDVVSIRTLPGKEDAMPRATSLDTASCLLKRLQKLSTSIQSIAFDACD
ncbi:MAG: hypothetical protein QOJ89_4235 [bacterium]